MDYVDVYEGVMVGVIDIDDVDFVLGEVWIDVEYMQRGGYFFRLGCGCDSMVLVCLGVVVFQFCLYFGSQVEVCEYVLYVFVVFECIDEVEDFVGCVGVDFDFEVWDEFYVG